MRRALPLLVLLAGTVGCSSEEPAGPGPGVDAGTEAGADAAPDANPDAPDAAAFAPSDKQLLSIGNLGANDEDPCVVRAADGRMLIAYFSERGGNADLYVKETSDGLSWSESRVTTSPDGDFYPHLHQDDAGRFHLVWFRWIALEVGSIWYSSSPDGVTWDPADEVQVTTEPDVDDWVPTAATTAVGDVLVFFASEKRDPGAASQVYFSRRAAGQTAWEPAAPVADLNDAIEHDTLPHVARTGGGLSLAFVRADPSAPVAYNHPSTDVYVATSTDGLSWTAPLCVTDDATDDVYDTFPALFADHAGASSLVWLSTRTGPPATSILPLSQLASYPEAARLEPRIEGYSPHLAATPTPGVFLGVWVEAEAQDPNAKDVYYRFLAE